MSSTQHQLIEQCATRLRGIVEALDNIHDNTPHRWSTDLDDVHSSAESLLALINDQAPTQAAQGLARAALAQPSPAQAEQHWPKLEKPAQVGAIRFRAGLSSRLVVEAAQRLYEFESTPEKEAERIERLQAFREQCFEPLGAEFSKVLSENLVELSSDAKPEQADEKPGDSILCYGCFAKGVGPDHFDEAGKCLAAQAEAERPEVVGYRSKESGMVYEQDYGLKNPEALTTVAECERIVGALRAENAQLRQHKNDYMDAGQETYRALQNEIREREAEIARLDGLVSGRTAERDAALARVAELEKELAMARDAAAKGYAARHATGGMEMELQELREKVTELRKELRSRWTYASTQATNCAGCGEHKHTPLRVDWMGGYVCLTCIDKKLEELHDDQAQHSVPEGWKPVPIEPLLNMMSDKDHDTRIMAERQLLSILADAPGKEVPQAWLDVQAERRRQVEAEGWTPEHDDEHSHGQMARAAACYALAGSSAPNDGTAALLVSLAWPWDEQWWKPSTARRDLVKACALALAEIERLDRATATQGGPRDA
ncbi:hypothetical protein RQ528_18715 [Pseudomonas aeruginosa]|uniref:hypothetical protein n=1 Tax=Pseudomonas aeruginosa TaxID=287 RepID=UPI0028CDD1DF|nr:hypothetical protein [Pseudomonas aeruginosa]MDT8139760.1 hypothetical protein [Pseudomonas aeruginosa]